MTSAETRAELRSTFKPPLPQSMQMEKAGGSLQSSLRNLQVYRKAKPQRLPTLEGQNACSLEILQRYYTINPKAPIDWRNGLDMRTLYPAQSADYLRPRAWNTFETNGHCARPFYEGALKEQLRHGTGRCAFRNRLFSFEGDWSNGVFHGHGRLTIGDGFYEGEFVNGEISGSGIR